VVDVLLDAFATRVTEGYTAAAPTLTRALPMLVDRDPGEGEAGRWVWLAGGRAGVIVAVELWDAEALRMLAARQAQFARRAGALMHLQLALSFLGRAHLLAGELNTAGLMVDEDRLIAEATGNAPLANARMNLAAWRGREAPALELIKASADDAAAHGWSSNAIATAVLHNGLGRHDVARDAARPQFERDGVGYGPFLVPELAEAASRTGDVELVRAAHEWLSERTRVIPSEWARGIEARVGALLSEGDAADRLYRESVTLLGRTRARVELARTHLLYGEWLRRERRRTDARGQLRIAHEMFTAMGAEAFADRAGRELLATGETARKRTFETRDQLTAQERQIARLARDGLSNPEIGARLFISPRTVKYHLRKVFIKLGISSRNELDRVLPSESHDAPPN
jgi:DNA-binding CsgD family transcriptional regulator